MNNIIFIQDGEDIYEIEIISVKIHMSIPNHYTNHHKSSISINFDVKYYKIFSKVLKKFFNMFIGRHNNFYKECQILNLSLNDIGMNIEIVSYTPEVHCDYTKVNEFRRIIRDKTINEVLDISNNGKGT